MSHRYWKVTFGEGETITSIEEVFSELPGDWVIVIADSIEDAGIKAVREFRRLHVKAKRKAWKEAGLCVCGGIRDRKRKNGGFWNSCTKCNSRHYRSNKARADGGPVITSGPRPKAPHLGAINARLQILCQVRDQWMRCPNVGAFSNWLNAQIKSLSVEENEDISAA